MKTILTLILLLSPFTSVQAYEPVIAKGRQAHQIHNSKKKCGQFLPISISADLKNDGEATVHIQFGISVDNLEVKAWGLFGLKVDGPQIKVERTDIDQGESTILELTYKAPSDHESRLVIQVNGDFGSLGTQSTVKGFSINKERGGGLPHPPIEYERDRKGRLIYVMRPPK